ncbi:hypothetical protein BDV25DRAFT_167251 [Aspergillus avenaceus]|uniref:Nitronate monooxygenase domain-containing protein n=1 Tax=Aspergillus avenaceus TaxID=36643 RepID=A0A5N6TD88_ASPAV|nr:hypothetical protein BDV25DRAFT_167251 [Aspergillus avenaceus]
MDPACNISGRLRLPCFELLVSHFINPRWLLTRVWSYNSVLLSVDMNFHQSAQSILQNDYPWTKTPFIASAPMARVAKPPLAVAVSRAGGLGFIAAGYTSENLEEVLDEAAELIAEEPIPGASSAAQGLPVGVGFICWSASLASAIPALKKHRPCAVWLFAPPNDYNDLVPWVTQIREATSHHTKIWVQVSTVADALDVIKTLQPDTLVLQGSDAGGHGLASGASIVSLVPEVHDKLREKQVSTARPIPLVAAGGISDGRAVAASINLGAQGCVMGTRFLASPESQIAAGYQKEVLRASDGGLNTVRTDVYDKIRDIHGWPNRYNGRALINRSYIEAMDGLGEEENRTLYMEEMEEGGVGYGPKGRQCTYAGTGVGLIREVMSAGDIVRSVMREANQLLVKGGSKARL